MKRKLKKILNKVLRRKPQKKFENVTFGRHTYYGGSQFIARDGGVIKIGNFCSIADGVAIINANHNYTAISTYPMSVLFLKSSDKETIGRDRIVESVIIGNDVWIGTKSVILKGVQVGDGAIIGAGSIVTKSIPPYAIAAGSPARVIKYRFSESQIQSLLKIKWWEWSDDYIKQNIDSFYLPVDQFIERFT